MKTLEQYRPYNMRREIEKATNTLLGLLGGIAIDNKINCSEMQELECWCSLQQDYEDFPPFSEIIPLVNSALTNNCFTEDEYESILYVCRNYADETIISDTISRSVQVLQGVLHGILADGKITDAEIYSLHTWIDKFDFLQGTYPYDEVSSLLADILADGIITEDERQILTAYISSFIDLTTSCNINESEINQLRQKYHISGICALDPHIEIRGHVFTFTGASSHGTRNDIAAFIADHDGIFSCNVTKKTEYLIVGDDGNPCWMFSCYGRKVEKAVELRKQGQHLTIIHESDFWDALQNEFC